LEAEKVDFSWRLEEAIFRGPKKLIFLTRKIDLTRTEKIGFLETDKAIFRMPEKSPIRGDLKKGFFGDGKISFCWRPKKRFFGSRERRG